MGVLATPNTAVNAAVKKATGYHFTYCFPRIIMEGHNLMLETNGVKGALEPNVDGSSPGRVSHGEQVGPDRQLATVRNFKVNLRKSKIIRVGN